MGSPAPALKSFVCLAFVLGSACTLNTDYFSEYRGKNLLANHGFGATGAWTLVTDAATATVAASHGHTYAATDYMTWSAVGSGTAADNTADTAASTVTVGPDGVSPAYRLEIKNLLTDGDFEALALGTGSTGVFWTPSGASTLTVDNAASTITRPDFTTFNLTLLNRQFLHWTAVIGGPTLTLDVKLATTAGLWMEGGYQFRYDLVNLSSAGRLTLKLTTTNAASLVSGGGAWDENPINSVATPTLYSRSRTLTINNTNFGGATTLNFGKIGDNDAVALDNVRLIKADIVPSVGLSFLSLSTGTLKLLPGTKAGAYTFSFYVRDDPTALASPGPGHRPNRLEPSGITVAITAAQKTANTLSPVFTPRPASGWTGWTKVTVDLGIDFVDTDSQLAGNPALVIRLTPTNTADNSTLGLDAGSLLVAQPVFTYNP